MADLDLEKLVTAIEQSLEGKGPGDVDAPLQRQAVEARFAQQWPEIEKAIKSAAVARGGGLDVGGFLTTTGKARTGFEVERLGALADIDKFLASLSTQRVSTGVQAGLGYRGQTQQASQFGEQMDFQKEQLAIQQAFLEEQRAAARKKSRDWWKPVLRTVVGTSVAGPLAGLAGGLFAGGDGKLPPLHAPGY